MIWATVEVEEHCFKPFKWSWGGKKPLQMAEVVTAATRLTSALIKFSRLVFICAFRNGCECYWETTNTAMCVWAARWACPVSNWSGFPALSDLFLLVFRSALTCCRSCSFLSSLMTIGKVKALVCKWNSPFLIVGHSCRPGGCESICYRGPLCQLPLSNRAAQLFSHTMKPVKNEKSCSSTETKKRK